jgi:PAT family beta-lactamase induction signal transducer AmpG
LPVPAGWSKVAGPISNSETTVHQPQAARPRNPWLWIPSLNFCSGVPYFVVIWLSVMMYKSLGVSNTDAALYTSWLYLPWVIKPLWSPLVEMFRTKRFWILAAQLLIGVSFGLVALAVPTTHFMRISLAALWLVAFSSATHDIAADGFYMLAQNEKDQAAFVGVRSTFYRISGLAAQAGLLFLSGVLTDYTGSATNAWHYVFLLLAVFFAAAALYHQFLLPRPADDHATVAEADPLKGYFSTLAAFFKKPDIGVTLAFLLLFRLGEAQALKLVGPFLLDPREKGGLALSPQTISWAYAGVGPIAITIGGLLGGWLISRHGLKKMLWPLVLAIHLPNLAFVLLAFLQPQNPFVVACALAVEQFGYGFGFTAFMMYMMMVSRGPQKTAHYSICTGFMAAGMMLPGAASGWIQDHVGYPAFFLWVCIATLPGLFLTARLKIDPEYGKRETA